MQAEAYTVVPLSTEKGLIYILDYHGELFVDREYRTITAVTSHVFDRFSERCFDSELSRMEAIQSYCWEQLPGWVIKKDMTYIKPSRKGFSLGEFAIIPHSSDVFLFLEKTFITLDQISEEQNKIALGSFIAWGTGKVDVEKQGEMFLP